MKGELEVKLSEKQFQKMFVTPVAYANKRCEMQLRRRKCERKRERKRNESFPVSETNKASQHRSQGGGRPSNAVANNDECELFLMSEKK